MAISPAGPVSTLVPDSLPQRPVEPAAQESTAQSETPQAVPPASSDTGIDENAPRERSVDITV